MLTKQLWSLMYYAGYLTIEVTFHASYISYILIGAQSLLSDAPDRALVRIPNSIRVSCMDLAGFQQSYDPRMTR